MRKRVKSVERIIRVQGRKKIKKLKRETLREREIERESERKYLSQYILAS
jgi:hypothetical protein